MIDLDLNPRVRQIIEAAIEAAQPIWIGLTEGKCEVMMPRRALWMEEIEPDHYVNGNSVSWRSETNLKLRRIVLAKSEKGPPFTDGPLLFDGAANVFALHPGDTLSIHRGDLNLHGRIP